MKNALLAVLGLLALVSTLAAEEPADQRTKAFNDAKVGLSIHWGLYAVPARARPGQLADRVMENENIPVKDYEKFAAQFTAAKFNADDWVRLAQEGGARYIVLSAKHHDGFCLWPSATEKYNALEFAAARRDIVKDVSAACDKAGVKFGVSYSLLDWHHPDFTAAPPKYVAHAHEQVKELLTKYPIWGVWFEGDDSHTMKEWESKELLALIRKERPQTLVNDRLGRDAHGKLEGVDFYTFENEIPDEPPLRDGKPLSWETWETIGSSWGYNASPEPLKGTDRIILDLVDTVSKGGNFLLNVTPRADGSIPEPMAQRLRVVGDWLKRNGEAIYGTSPGPFGGRLPGGRVTMKGNRLYLFGERRTVEGFGLPGLTNKVKKAWILENGAPLKVFDDDGTPTVMSFEKMVDPLFTVIVIELDGPPVVKKK